MAEPTSKPKRRWFQFSLRTLMVFVTLCAVLCSWHQYNLARKRAELARAADQLSTNVQQMFFGEPEITDAELKHFERFCQLEVLSLKNADITDAGLEHLRGMKNLRHLYLKGTKVTDSGVKKLQKALPNCQIEN
jgi:hypothetical protein